MHVRVSEFTLQVLRELSKFAVMIRYCRETIHGRYSEAQNPRIQSQILHTGWYNRTLNLHARAISSCIHTHITTHRTAYSRANLRMMLITLSQIQIQSALSGRRKPFH
jgi:hypothetical protein